MKSTHSTYLRYEQESAYASPWSFGQRVRMMCWEWCWALFCRWTPKPCNAWRVGWLKLFGGKVSGKPFIHQRARIQIPWHLTLHDAACLGDGANAYSLGHIEIGKGATVSQEAYLCSGTHDLDHPDTPLVTGAIVIGPYAFIAARAFVMPGVRVGEGAVLGAMSVATKDLPPWTIWAGNPAQPIKQRKKRQARINIVQGAFLPVPAVKGGAVEKVWESLGREFAKAGYAVNHISRQLGELPAEEMIAGVRHLRVPGFDACSSLLKLKLRDLIYSLRVRRILPAADITVTNTFWMPLLLRASRHGATYVHVARFPKWQMKLYSRAARLQPVSTLVGEAIKRQTPSVAHLVRALPNPLPADWLADESTLSVARKPTLLYVGRVHPEKGLELLLDAFGKLPAAMRREWTLSVVGPWAEEAGGGGERYLKELKQRELRNQIQVDWIGPTYDQQALQAQYDRSEIFVYPSRATRGEAFGLAPLEAMARGSAPIVSSLECFREFLQHDLNGLIFSLEGPDVARNLADCLERLISSPELRLRLRRAALQTAADYSVTTVARRYLDDFEALAHA